MKPKLLLDEERDNILKILKDKQLSAEEKLEHLDIIQLIENLDIYEAELEAQNEELRMVEKELSKSRDEFSSLYNLAPIAYFALDKEFKIVKYNDKATTLFSNFSPFQINKPFSNAICKKDFKNYINFQNLIKNENECEAQLELTNSLESIHTKLNISKVVYEDKDELYYLSVQDITTEVQQKQMLIDQAKNVAMGEMLAMITHQWKQPLSVVLTLTTSLQYLLSQDEYSKEVFQNMLKQIEDQTEYMSDTVYDFKHFFDASSEKVVLDTTQCIDRALRFTSVSIKKTDIDLQVNYIDNPTVTTFGYSNDICQTLMNILNNAKDVLLTKEGSKNIWLDVYNENDTIVFSIKNNGGTIPKDFVEHIFEKSFTTKGHEDGSGLGLYISKMIVEDHLNGTICVENLEDEDSVVFKVIVPIYNSKGE